MIYINLKQILVGLSNEHNDFLIYELYDYEYIISYRLLPVLNTRFFNRYDLYTNTKHLSLSASISFYCIRFLFFATEACQGQIPVSQTAKNIMIPFLWVVFHPNRF